MKLSEALILIGMLASLIALMLYVHHQDRKDKR